MTIVNYIQQDRNHVRRLLKIKEKPSAPSLKSQALRDVFEDDPGKTDRLFANIVASFENLQRMRVS